jgi:hypothetical protein
MPRPTAAIFDLDRTLISTSSAGIFRAHLAEAAIGSGDLDSLPLVDVFSRFYNQFGENWLMMQPARLASRAAAGWDVDGNPGPSKPPLAVAMRARLGARAVAGKERPSKSELE